MNVIARSVYPRFSCRYIILLITLIVLVIHPGMAMRVCADEAANVDVRSDGILLTPAVQGVTFMMLRVADPQGEMIGEQSSDGSPITWSPPAGAQEGIYTYEVRVGFGERNRTREDPQQQAPRVRPWRQSGTVYVTGGSILPPTSMERSFLEDIFSGVSTTFAKLMDLLTPPAYADVLHYDDVIITGSLGVGFDCINGESFGYDTLKLKENNLRFFFEDTSIGTFPANDWRIVINDTTSGGASYFAVLVSGRQYHTWSYI
jgi:hypothetical protein